MWLNTINADFPLNFPLNNFIFSNLSNHLSNQLLENLPRLFILLGLGLITVYLIILLVVRQVQKYIIFKPYKQVQGSPADVNLAYETVWISNLEGNNGNNQEKLYGWWIPQNNQEAPVILYLHGNRGNLAVAPSFRNLQRVAKLHQLGFAILMIDYRGYGYSPGVFPTEAQVYQDAEWAWQYLVQTQNCHPKKIWVYGHSLGGAIAGHLCKNHPEAAGLIADGCFTSMADMARDTWLKIFPSDWLITQKFPLINYVQSLQIPVLFIHGTADRTVPSYMSEKLFAVAPEPKQLYLVNGAGHDNLSEFAGQEYLDTLIKFTTDHQPSNRLIELN